MVAEASVALLKGVELLPIDVGFWKAADVDLIGSHIFGYQFQLAVVCLRIYSVRIL
jgi:hypothetical protein